MKRVEPGIFYDQLLIVISIELVRDIGQRRGLEHQLPLSPRSRVGDVWVLILLNLLGETVSCSPEATRMLHIFPGAMLGNCTLDRCGVSTAADGTPGIGGAIG